MRRPSRAPVASCLLLAVALIALPGCLVSPARATDTGKKLKLPGQPASMRGRAR
jgi:hypothetical protein